MKINLKMFALFALFLAGNLLADSWVEKPDVEFHIDPLIESHGRWAEPEINRIPIITLAGCLFFAGVLLINFAKGMRALLALIISTFLMTFVFFFLSLRGIPPLAGAVFLSAAATALTLALVSAEKRKSIPALLGGISGILAVAGFSYFFLLLSKVQGFSITQVQLLNYIVKVFEIKSLSAGSFFIAGIIIASAGVIMDVAISVSSSLCEIESNTPLISAKKLFKSGIKISQDITATMANSLIFAWIGVSFFYILGISFRSFPFHQAINSEWVAVIFAEIVSGTFGIMVTGPLTSFFFYLKKLRRPSYVNQ